jgi:hypothetical protein
MPHSSYFAERMGRAEISPQGEFEAGSFQSFTLTYTAGYFGIDDTGSLKIVHRFASDMGRPQFNDPAGWNYTTVEASNGAVLEVKYDGKLNIRPWDKTLFIRVVRGFLREGDRIVVRIRRSASGLARNPRANVQRADVRISRAGRCVGNLQLRRAARAAVYLGRRRSAGAL